MFAVVGFVPYTGISSLGRYVTITPDATFSISILDTEDGVVEDYNQDSLRELYKKCPALKVLGVHAENGSVQMIYVPREYFFKSTPSKRFHVLLEQVTDKGCRAVVTIFDKEKLLVQFKTHGVSGKDWFLKAVREYKGVLHILLKIGYGTGEEFYAIEYGIVDRQFMLTSKSLSPCLDSAFSWYIEQKENGENTNHSDSMMEQQVLRTIREAPVGTEFCLRSVFLDEDRQEIEAELRGIRTGNRDMLVLVSKYSSLNVGVRYITFEFAKVVARGILESVRFSLYATQRDIDEYYRAGVRNLRGRFNGEDM